MVGIARGVLTAARTEGLSGNVARSLDADSRAVRCWNARLFGASGGSSAFRFVGGRAAMPDAELLLLSSPRFRNEKKSPRIETITLFAVSRQSKYSLRPKMVVEIVVVRFRVEAQCRFTWRPLGSRQLPRIPFCLAWRPICQLARPVSLTAGAETKTRGFRCEGLR